MKKWILFLLFFPLLAGAQRAALVERIQEVQSRQKNPVLARQEMVNQATDRVSETLIKEIIGEAKFNRNKVLIQSKIIRNAARYIPFSKPSELQPLEPEGFKMTVTLRANVDELQALLLEGPQHVV